QHRPPAVQERPRLGEAGAVDRAPDLRGEGLPRGRLLQALGLDPVADEQQRLDRLGRISEDLRGRLQRLPAERPSSPLIAGDLLFVSPPQPVGQRPLRPVPLGAQIQQRQGLRRRQLLSFSRHKTLPNYLWLVFATKSSAPRQTVTASRKWTHRV